MVAATKNLAVAIAFTSLSTCAVTYARRDYDQYPARRRDIAVFNMRAIAQDFCQERFMSRYPFCEAMSISDASISFSVQDCGRWEYYTAYNMQQRECRQILHRSREIYWNTIRKIIPVADRVRICNDSSECEEMVGFRNARQAADFAEAMSMYLR